MAGFGASYAIASLGCTVAPFLAVVVTAFRAGSTAAGVALFLAYAAGMGLVVGAAAVAVALARGGLIRRLRRIGPVLPRLGGLLLLVAGGYVAWYGAWELRVLHGQATADPVVEAAGHLQRWLVDAAHSVGATGFLAVLVALVAAGLLWRGRPSTRDTTTGDPTAEMPTLGDPTTQAGRRTPEEHMKMQAVWNDTVVAESDQTIVVEGNHYFPEDSLRPEYFIPSTSTTICPWKGIASYYHVTVTGQTNRDAAWQYRHPLPLARKVKNRVAFWHGVQVVPVHEREARR
jgi:uncharacterized protein (DUF427 family)